jgi:peptidoglycan/xylan/chitin deacetylase (PgdA/CDA1 family)
MRAEADGDGRRLLKAGAALAVRWSGAGRLIGALRGPAREPLVLGYHGVVEDPREHAQTAIPAILTSRRMLERHLECIGRRRRFVSLDELGTWPAGGRGGPPAAITFDDGYASVYELAFPLLKARGIPAAIFVVTDLLGSDRPHLHDYLYLLLARAYASWRDPALELGALLRRRRIAPPPANEDRALLGGPLAATQALLRDLPQESIRRVLASLEAEFEAPPAALRQLRPMTWEMVEEMRRAGVVVGSHTRSHGLMTNESRERMTEEIAGSRRELERRLGGPVVHFAYPGGCFDAAAVEAVREAGYRFAYTCCGHRDPRHPLLTIPRRILWENACLGARGSFSTSVMDCQVNGVFDLVSPCRMDHDTVRRVA